MGLSLNPTTQRSVTTEPTNSSHSQAALVEPFELSERGVIFNVNTKGEPNFKKVVFDPLEANPGEVQKMRLGIKNGVSLKRVEAEVTCGHTRTIAFEQTHNGENMELWQGSMKIPEQVENPNCEAVFEAEDQQGDYNQYTFRWNINK